MALTGRINPTVSVKSQINPTRSVQAKNVTILPGNNKLSELSDIDISAREDGSMIIYDHATQTFKVRPDLENPNASIIGGSF